MGIQRAALIGGPATIVFDGATLWTADDLILKPEAKTQDIVAAMFGRVDEALGGVMIRASFTPFALWQHLAVLYPAQVTNPVAGARVCGDADKPCQIWSSNGDLYTLTAAAVTKPPALRLGADQPLFGKMEIAGVVGNGKNLEDADSLYKIQTGQSAAGGQFSMTNCNRQRWSATWGSVAGFNGFEAEDHFELVPEIRLEPVKVGGLTRDFKVVSGAWLAKCRPVGPTGAQIEAAQRLQGSGNRQGRRLGGAAWDLTLTGADGHSVVLNQAALKTAGFRFGASVLRNGEIGFVTTTEFAGGAPQPLVVIT